MPCSVCGAEGTNKSTCPFSPGSNPNPAKHNSHPLPGKGSVNAGVVVAVKVPAKLKPVAPLMPALKPLAPLMPALKPLAPLMPALKPVAPLMPALKPVAPLMPAAKPVVKPVAPAAKPAVKPVAPLMPAAKPAVKPVAPLMPAAKPAVKPVAVKSDIPAPPVFAKAPTKYQYTQAELDEMEADMVKLSLPSLPVTYEAIDENIGTHCALCYNYIKVGKWTSAIGSVGAKMSEIEFYDNMEKYCASCANLIATQYQTDALHNRKRYKTYHEGPLERKTILTHGNKDGYYNHTMQEGAKFWSAAGGRRKSESIIAALNALPSPPK